MPIPDGLYGLAAAVLGTTPDGIRWPYGMSPPRLADKRTDPQRYEQRLTEHTAKLISMVSWAERHGLTQSPLGCCPPWLLRAQSRRCRARARVGEDRCTRYGSAALDYDWLDHAVGWLKDGRPAVLTSAPYSLQYLTEQPWRLQYWLAQDPRLKVTAGDGWYSGATAQLIMWRSDRIGEVRPAAAPDC